MRVHLFLSIGLTMALISGTSAQSELSIKMTPTLLLTGPSGDYQIQRAQVLGATTNWITITNVTLSGGALTYYDTTAASAGQQFYRAVQQTPDNPDPQRLVWIEPGTFTMGSPSTELDSADGERPQTVVTLNNGFWMGKYEVTQEEYQAVMGKNPSFFTGDPKRPVEQVTWIDATNYCAKLTDRERLENRLPAGYVYRLPTEAEWEYACRAGTTTPIGIGDGISLSSTQANFDGRYPYGGAAQGPDLQQTTAVGSYATSANAWGLYDMHGNVFEWCLDWNGAYPGGNVIDWRQTSAGSFRVLRGGSWEGRGKYCRSAFRYFHLPDDPISDYGFRVVLAPGP
jgi:formylglycine-generating enzyme required for sulfatase activity